jgi:hypothetical protein
MGDRAGARGVPTSRDGARIEHYDPEKPEVHVKRLMLVDPSSANTSMSCARAAERMGEAAQQRMPAAAQGGQAIGGGFGEMAAVVAVEELYECAVALCAEERGAESPLAEPTAGGRRAQRGAADLGMPEALSPGWPFL